MEKAEHAFARARRRGYLRIGASRAEESLVDEWAAWCRQRSLDVLVVQRRRGASVRLRVEVDPRRPLSFLGQQETRDLLARAPDGEVRGGLLVLDGLEGPAVSYWIREVRELLARDRTPERALRVEEVLPRSLEGQALCVDNTGYEEILEVGDRVYLRELPNAPGRCLVVREREGCLLGVPTERFRLEPPCGA